MADETSDALQAGANFFGALTNEERKTDAYNALNKAYGPAIAYDPAAASNAATANVNTQTQGDKIAASARVNNAGAALVDQYGAAAGDPDAAAKAQETKLAGSDAGRMAAFRALKILGTAVDPTTNSVSPDKYKQIMGTYGPMLGMAPEQIDQLGQQVTAPGGAAHLDTIQQALIGPQTVTGAGTVVNGADGPQIVRFDKFGNPIVTALPGKTAGLENADTGAKKVPILQQNADTNSKNANTKVFSAQTGRLAEQTGQYRAAVGANNSLFGAPAGATLPGGGGQVTGGGTAPVAQVAAKGGGTVAAHVDPQSLFATLPPKGRQQAIGSAQQIMNQGTQLDNTNTLLNSALKQISPYTAGTGSLMKELPGTAAADLRANLTTLKANGQMAWISSMKNSAGQTGIGRVLQSEAKNAESLYGAMEQDQSAKQLAYHMGLFKTAVNNLYAHSRQGFQAQWGVSPEGAMGQPEHPATTGAAPGGKTYTFDPKTGTIQ